MLHREVKKKKLTIKKKSTRLNKSRPCNWWQFISGVCIAMYVFQNQGKTLVTEHQLKENMKKQWFKKF